LLINGIKLPHWFLPNLLSPKETVDESPEKPKKFFLSLIAKQRRCPAKIPATA